MVCEVYFNKTIMQINNKGDTVVPQLEVSLEPEAKVAFSSKQSVYHRGTSWGNSFWNPTLLSVVHGTVASSPRHLLEM